VGGNMFHPSPSFRSWGGDAMSRRTGDLLLQLANPGPPEPPNTTVPSSPSPHEANGQDVATPSTTTCGPAMIKWCSGVELNYFEEGEPDGLKSAAERAGVSPMTRSVPVGVRVVRPASRTQASRRCTGLPPTLAELLEPSSQRTRLPLGFGCHCRNPLRMMR
jgi:hypothetical protein